MNFMLQSWTICFKVTTNTYILLVTYTTLPFEKLGSKNANYIYIMAQLWYLQTLQRSDRDFKT